MNLSKEQYKFCSRNIPAKRQYPAPDLLIKTLQVREIHRFNQILRFNQIRPHLKIRGSEWCKILLRCSSQKWKRRKSDPENPSRKEWDPRHPKRFSPKFCPPRIINSSRSKSVLQKNNNNMVGFDTKLTHLCAFLGYCMLHFLMRCRCKYSQKRTQNCFNISFLTLSLTSWTIVEL